MTVVDNPTQGLTINQAAAELGVHYQTIRNRMAKHDQGKPGGLPYTAFGTSAPGTLRTIRIHPDDLEQFRPRRVEPG